MPSFDEIEFHQGIGTIPQQGPSSPYWVLKSTFDLGAQSTMAAENNDVIQLTDALRPFIISHCFLRLDVTTFVGTSMEVSVGHSGNLGSLIPTGAFLITGTGDVIIPMTTTDRGPVLDQAESTHGVYQETGDDPFPSGHAIGAITAASEIQFRTNPTTMTTFAGTGNLWLVGFHLA